VRNLSITHKFGSDALIKASDWHDQDVGAGPSNKLPGCQSE
jgi:hypothetical protein